MGKHIYSKRVLAPIHATLKDDKIRPALSHLLFTKSGDIVGVDGFMLIRTTSPKSEDTYFGEDIKELKNDIKIHEMNLKKLDLFKFGRKDGFRIFNDKFVLDTDQKKNKVKIITKGIGSTVVKELGIPEDKSFPDYQMIIDGQVGKMMEQDRKVRVRVSVQLLENMVKALKQFSVGTHENYVDLYVDTKTYEPVIFKSKNVYDEKFLGILMPRQKGEENE